MDIKSVVEKFIQLRDQKAEIAARHKEELAPITQSMEVIEKWLFQQMETMGVDSLKTEAGTPYKSVSKSVKMTDGEAFKRFTFAPVIEALSKASTLDSEQIYSLLQNGIRWDMIDFRAGKRGVQEYADEAGKIPPGIEMDSYTTVLIRRS